MSPRTLHNPNNLPRELWQYRQFVCWRYVDNGKPKLDKVPINPRTLRNAGSTWPDSWADIRTAVRAYQANEWLAGIGFVLTAHDPFVMVDLDDCWSVDQLTPFAASVVDALNTYTERSPSVKGLRFFVKAKHQPKAIKRLEIEIYSSQRFATVTGDVLHQWPVAECDDLAWFIERFAPQEEKRPTTFLPAKVDVPADDAQVWQRIFAKNRLAYELYSGNLSRVDNGDHSRAVILLLNSLAYWTGGDAGRMERMIAQTSLDKTKWDQRRGEITWLQARILDACNYMGARR